MTQTLKENMMSDGGTGNGSGERNTVIKLPVNQGFQVTDVKVKLCVGHC